jgi:hypothetical protein
MKRLAIAMMILMITAGFAFAKDFAIEKKAGDYTVNVTLDKNPPVTGNNNMTISIRDAKGAAVTDATVTVDYGMPAMPGMPAMNYKAKTELKKNLYTGALNFSMSGAWFVNIKITKASKTQTVKLNVDVR